MPRSPLRFHAAAPGEWINDPNALWHDGQGWTLLVQHRADAPDWRKTGWGRFTSPDLLDWTWQGPAIPAADQGYAYSGCVVRDDGRLLALHTEHRPGPPREERQQLRRSSDGGAYWGRPEQLPVPPLEARRDPFLVRDEQGWRMLLARPCPWDGWEKQPGSVIEWWRAPDLRQWKLSGRFGPCDPPGVLWEVPVLLPGPADAATLLISRVDRRRGRAACDVRWWHGTWDAGGLHARSSGPLDLGPDFYAATVAVDQPDLLVGWLSSWDTARAMDWPGFAGGPISLPRQLSLAHGRLCVAVHPAVADAFARPLRGPVASGMAVACLPGAQPFALRIAGSAATLVIEGDPASGQLAARRDGSFPFDWAQSHHGLLCPTAARTLRLFIDGPVVELFLEPDGLSLSAVVPGSRPLDISLPGTGFSWWQR